jgi:glycerate kinase
VVCLSGGLGEGAEAVLSHGIDALEVVVDGPMPLEEAMARAESLVEAAAARACRLLRAGRSLRD